MKISKKKLVFPIIFSSLLLTLHLGMNAQNKDSKLPKKTKTEVKIDYNAKINKARYDYNLIRNIFAKYNNDSTYNVMDIYNRELALARQKLLQAKSTEERDLIRKDFEILFNFLRDITYIVSNNKNNYSEYIAFNEMIYKTDIEKFNKLLKKQNSR